MVGVNGGVEQLVFNYIYIPRSRLLLIIIIRYYINCRKKLSANSERCFIVKSD